MGSQRKEKKKKSLYKLVILAAKGALDMAVLLAPGSASLRPTPIKKAG